MNYWNMYNLGQARSSLSLLHINTFNSSENSWQGWGALTLISLKAVHRCWTSFLLKFLFKMQCSPLSAHSHQNKELLWWTYTIWSNTKKPRWKSVKYCFLKIGFQNADCKALWWEFDVYSGTVLMSFERSCTLVCFTWINEAIKEDP